MNVLAHFDMVSCSRSWGSIISKVRRLWFGQSGAWFPAGARISFSPECLDWLWGLPVLLSPWVKWSGRDAGHSLPCSAEFKIEWSSTSIPLHCVLSWCAQGQLWSLIQREFDSGVLGRSGRKWLEGTGKCIMRSFGICILHEMLIRMDKSRRIWWTGHVPCTGEWGTTYKVLVGEPEREYLGTPRNRCEDNVRMNHEDRWWKNMDWNLVYLA